MNRLLDRLARSAKTPPSQPLSLRLPNRLLYAINHCYPFSSNGYAVRTHSIATALVRSGVQVVAASRPGMPWDQQIINLQAFSCDHCIDGVRYLHRPTPSAWMTPKTAYLTACADAWAELIRVFKPTAVMAASNWRTALPAAIAAHETGLPFLYEVRGFWELSRAAKEPRWAGSLEYQQAVDCETRVACCAHRVFTLNRHMRNELVQRGIATKQVELVPNGFPGWKKTSAAQTLSHQSLGITSRYVFGYIGSFNDYEGLELLVEALALLRQCGVNVALLLVGSSASNGLETGKDCPAIQQYRKLARQLGVASYLHMPGRIHPEQVGEYYALLDVVVIARRPLPVCELVSPMKPLEAAAYGKQVLMSDVAPLADLSDVCGNFHYFAKGNVGALAEKLANLLRAGNFSPPRSQELETMRWDRTVQPMIDIFKELQTCANPKTLHAPLHRDPSKSM